MRTVVTLTLATAIAVGLAGCSADEDAVSLADAVDLALADAGVTQSDATVVDKHSFEIDDEDVHGVTFVTDDARYRYEIDAATGDILGAYVDERDPATTEESPTPAAEATATGAGAPASTARVQPEVTPTEALDAALAEAGVARADARDWDTDLEYDGTAPFYEVSFDAGTLEHEVWVDAVTGDILESWSETD